MLKNFTTWFIVFGLSFLVSDVFGWTEQGKAFFYIHLGVSIILILVLIAMLIVAGLAGGFAAKANGVSILIVFITAGLVAIDLLATWGATKLFGVDFYVAYQIMTFGQCLSYKKDKEED